VSKQESKGAREPKSKETKEQENKRTQERLTADRYILTTANLIKIAPKTRIKTAPPVVIGISSLFMVTLRLCSSHTLSNHNKHCDRSNRM
jgi:hypothetical protein